MVLSVVDVGIGVWDRVGVIIVFWVVIVIVSTYGCEGLIPLEVSRGLFPLRQFLTQSHGFGITR